MSANRCVVIEPDRGCRISAPLAKPKRAKEGCEEGEEGEDDVADEPEDLHEAKCDDLSDSEGVVDTMLSHHRIVPAPIVQETAATTPHGRLRSKLI